ECQGAMWVEPDMNLTSGESLVRQLLYGKRFFRSEFGVDVKNLWLPDVFGYSAALPQILKLAGVDAFMTQKISWNESNTFPHHTFDWEGIDGTRIRTHFLPTNTYNAANAPDEMIEAEKRFSQADVSGDWLNLYGIGDGGGGPSRRHIEFALRSQNTEGLPRLKLAPADDFLKRVEKIPAERLPLWRGELYLELHRGTYTTQARMKYLNRRLELTLRDAEFLAAISGADQRDDLARIWKNTLLNQFHDILPGSSIREVYEDANGESEANLDALEKLERASLGALHGAEPEAARAYVVYNTLSWARRALVRIPWTDSTVPGVRDSEGSILPVQPVDGGLLVRVTIPSMGLEAFTVSDSADTAGASPAGEAPAAGSLAARSTAESIENDLLRVRLGSDGTIASIYDRELEREVLAEGANRLMLWEDLPYSWDAWDISHYYRETRPVQATLVERELVESGPLRGVVEQTLTVGASTIRQRIVLEAGSRLVRIENHVDWKESRKQLRVEARPAINALEANYEIQFGTVRRPTHANTSWDAAQFEVAGQRFADYSQADYGLGLVNDGKYGHSIRDGVMDLTLLRSPVDPDPTADIGEHDFVFGYYPHALGWQASDLLERARELNSPVLVRGVAKPPQERRSEYSVTGGRVKLETVKYAEDGEAIILRLYETRGMNQNVVLASRVRWATIVEVDLLEENPRKVSGPKAKASAGEGYASAISLSFGPYQIRTFRVTAG
ncbi:MAG: alpha-mannosidase, partial [Spirochaetota bacterium]